MSNYPNLYIDHSDVEPSKRLLAAMKWKRENSKPISDFRRVKCGDKTLCYACSPRCSDMALAIMTERWSDGEAIPFISGLTDRKGLPSADYRDVRCFIGCKWRVL